MKDVFISYKAEEIEQANWVKTELENEGISCWMAPDCISGGSSYAVEIPKAIRQAKFLVLILSSKAQESQWVCREVDLAISEGKTVLPFMIEKCTLKDDFQFYLANVQYYTAYADKGMAMKKMCSEIKALVVRREMEPIGEGGDKEIVRDMRVHTKHDILSIGSVVFGTIAAFVNIQMFNITIILAYCACVLSILGLESIRQKDTSGKGLAITGQALGICMLLCCLIVWFGAVGGAIWLIIAGGSLVLFIKGYKALKV